MKEYINISKLERKLTEILIAARENCKDEESTEIINYYYDDDSIEEYAHAYAESINRDIYKYLHADSQKIPGNFNNIVVDYCKERTGEHWSDYDLFRDMVERLDAGREDKRTNKDRNFLLDWFFETVGTWGIVYNFQEMIGETIYQELEAERA